MSASFFFFFQAEDGIRDRNVTGVQTCALPISSGGVDPDQDLRMVVLPPPYMVESISSGHVDAFCVGAPWNSVAVDRSEERRVGKECRSRWSPQRSQKKL